LQNFTDISSIDWRPRAKSFFTVPNATVHQSSYSYVMDLTADTNVRGEG